MSESYTPREFIDAINDSNPDGVRFDPYNTDHLRAQLQAQQAEGGDILAQAQSEVDERARERLANSPEAKIQVAKEQIEAMKQWLIADKTYDDADIDQIISGLSVEYDEESQEAVVKGYLVLSSLTSAKGLTLPNSIGGDLNLASLTSAEHLKLPTTVGGYLVLSSLTSAEHLTLPTTISGGLNLDSLTSAEHLTLPTTVGGGLGLSGLTSAKHLTLPTTIGGTLWLNGLTSAEKDVIRTKYPHINIFS